MKVITNNGLAKYVFDDSTEITLKDNQIVTENFIIGDLNSNNITLYTSITNTPSGWIGDKYNFDGTTWTIVDGWEDFDPDNIPI